MLLSDLDYTLPPELIAQEPLADRAASRLLVVDRSSGAVAHRRFRELPELLRPGDVLAINDTRVFPARLLGRRRSGGRGQILLIRRLGDDGEGPAEAGHYLSHEIGAGLASGEGPAGSLSATGGELWEALVWPGRKMRRGDRMQFEGPRGLRLEAEIVGRGEFGRRTVALRAEGRSVEEAIDAVGRPPLPPYIRRLASETDRERYQTVYARQRGSIAAPTAGLHFTQEILDELRGRGIEIVPITLHVGYGTFQPIRTARLEDDRMESENYEISPGAAASIAGAHAEGRRVVGVGTTVTRALESAAVDGEGMVAAGRRSTDLFIMPGFRFRAIDALITNFHLPRSSLLSLVCAFGGRERMLEAYRIAVEKRYRFYSYGDAMLIA